MMQLRSLACGLAAAACLAAWWQYFPAPALPATPPISPRSSSSAPADLLVGTRSCVTAGCHGRVAPLPEQRIQQNEYTVWVTEDIHARAYDALCDERSERIMKALGGKVAAHEDARCLACHSNPLTAANSAAPLLRDERLLGVGCEACHGEAGKWLQPHQNPAWGEKPAEEKRAAGMTPPGDIVSFARRCVGCHVGAPSHPAAPLRDVNHDLIAAGHPRLNFELTAYLANLPRHWSKKIDEERAKNSELEIWGKGQLVSALAALELLADRADGRTGSPDSRPWPELAEYDCFACHHDLKSPSWRQTAVHYRPRRPGSLSWGGWYFTGPRLLAGRGRFTDARGASLLDSLTKEMQSTWPDRQKVRALAMETADRLGAPLRDATRGSDAPALRSVLLYSLQNNDLTIQAWEPAEQLYLGLSTLPELQQQGTARQSLDALGEELAIPLRTGPVKYESPRKFETDRERIVRLLIEIRKRLQK